MKEKLNKKWRFYLQDFPQNSLGKADLWARDFDDSNWKEIDIPYDWAVKYPFNKKNSSGTGYLPGGIAWYRYHFNDVKDAKHAFICFDGVYKHSKIWLNGYYLGNWQNGFTSFEKDASEALKKEGENVLAVCVEHPDIADCRWYTGSGITRPVYIKYTNEVYFPDDGVKFTTKDNKEFSVAVKVKNLSTESKNVSVKLELKTLEGKSLYSKTQELNVEPQNCAKTDFSEKIDFSKGFELWSPENPFIFDLNVNLFIDEKESDSYSTKVGIRELKFDSNKGFFCNGKNYKLKGLCLHEDAGVWGNAVPKEVWRRRLLKLKSVGCNALRMSHNPHSEELYELCDELGFFVYDELYDEWQEPKNKWWQGHNVYPPSHQGITDDFLSCYKQDVRSFITKRQNHPCVIMWSIGNEIDYPNDPYCSPKFKEMTGNNDASKPAAERQFNPNHPDISQIASIAKMLSAEVKKWDTTRPVTMALAFPELSIDTGVVDALDVIGYNYKEQFYEQDHKRFPDKMFLGSENQHGLEYWESVVKNDYIAGQFLWTGADYLGEAKGWPIHGSGAGLLNLAGFEKPLYYFRKALWSDEKFVKIFTSPTKAENWSESWNYSEGDKIDVRVYTNQKSVQLFLDNKLFAEKESGQNPYVDFTLDFDGTSELLAKSGDVMDVVSYSGAASRLNVEVEDFNKGELKQVEVYVTDDAGNFVSTADTKITVEVEGNAELVGLENGDLSDVTEYSANYRHAFNGELIAYILVHGKSSAKFKANGMKDTVLTF